MKSQTATIAFGNFHLSRGYAFSVPFSSNALLPNKKKGGKFLVYFRFLSTQNAPMPMTLAIATASMMATSVVMIDTSPVGSTVVGSSVVGSTVVGSSVVGSSVGGASVVGSSVGGASVSGSTPGVGAGSALRNTEAADP